MSATHGKFGNVYRLESNGFKGSGLNDVTWGSGFAGGSSAYYEVVIDAAGTPDTFKWRKNGGGWTTGVSITGAAQTLDDSQTITFAATTGHTLNDQWSIGNLKDEACTESGTTAQITSSTLRLLNPNSPPTFTDSGGANVLKIDYTKGMAYFDANVATVTVTGNDAHLLESGLQKCGYLFDWEMEVALGLVDKSAFQEHWKTWLPDLGEFNGKADGYFMTEAWFEDLKDCADGTLKYFFLQLFSYDPDDDQTGDHYNIWAIFSGFNLSAPIGDTVKEAISFQGHGIPSFTANA